MADEIKKTTDEVKQNMADTQEGIVSDEESGKVAGGYSGVWEAVLNNKPTIQRKGNTKDR